MNLRLPSGIFITCCILSGFSAHGQTSVVQCLDAEGITTFTNTPCKVEQRTVPAPTSVKNMQRKIAGPAQTQPSYADAEKARAASWANTRTTELNRAMASDVATLKKARASLLSEDQARDARRRQAALARL